MVSCYHLPPIMTSIRAREGKMEDKSGTSCCARTEKNVQGNVRGKTETRQKNIEANLEGFLLAKSGTISLLLRISDSNA